VTRILVAEDDLEIAGPLVRSLQSGGYSVALVTDGVSALEKAKTTQPDIIVLDLGLPKMDGLDVCRNLRAQKYEMPILILTARTSELDLVVGLDAGADDYIMKPFKSSELLARLRALMRRVEGHDVINLIGNGISLNTEARICQVGELEVSLTSTEFQLLELLMRNSGRVISRQQILRDVWNTDWSGSTKNLDMHLSALRRKLGEEGEHISTVRGLGFRFDRK
jgi:DNA-binding response OmpR family regulator